jgi:voltage-gated potassium channel
VSKAVFKWLLLLVVILVGAGTVFFHHVEKWSLLDSYYYCVVTLTTVGYGDFTPKTDLGKLAATLYIFFGVGIIAVFVQGVVRRSGSEILKKRAAEGKFNDSRSSKSSDK